MSRKRCSFLLLFALCFLIAIEAKGGFRVGGGYRTGGRTPSSGNWGSRSSSGGGWNSYSSSRRATSAPSYSRNYASSAPSRNSYNGPQRAVHQPTPRPTYTLRTQPTLRSPTYNYPSQSYPTQNHGVQRNPSYSYTTARPVYSVTKSSHYPTQATYPRNNYNPSNYGGGYRGGYGGGYGGNYRPNYQNSYNSYSPYYTPSYSKYPNLYQPVGKYKDHSVRNSVIAGLGGSALGMYLGYKLGSYMHQPSIPPMGGGYYGATGGYGGIPPYSVVHHYHHGEKAIPQTFEVKRNAVTSCNNTADFCTPNTTPLCMTNGTIYCVTPISAAASCNETKLTNLPCLNTTISVPCVNASDPNCHNGTMLSETVAIPCVSNITVFGDFATNKLHVHSLSGDSSASDTTLTGQGIKNNFCVTVIAEPVKVPEKMNNKEYLWYLEDNPKEKEVVQKKTEDIWSNVINYIFY